MTLAGSSAGGGIEVGVNGEGGGILGTAVVAAGMAAVVAAVAVAVAYAGLASGAAVKAVGGGIVDVAVVVLSDKLISFILETTVSTPLPVATCNNGSDEETASV